MAAQADFRDDVRVGGKSIYETSSDVTQQETRGEERWWELVLWSSVVSSLAAVLARFLLVPLVKVILIPVFAITLKIISVTIFESGRRQAVIEREACEIVDAIKKWRHFLLGRRFRLVTDQQSVRFMFDAKNHRKIKNGKIGVDEQAVNGTASHKGEDRPSANQSQERSPSHRMELWQMFSRITNGLVRQERSPSLKRSEVQLNLSFPILVQ
ncbi:hypothetical protein Pcinc_026923 [Petrolisthes cinctipes]|uniref:Reverse transcriptase RNase H-like domain-containing protein n=1 Tax=Petrolisthes cinctipes TaxID=88211 RepID=A0AAE1F5Y8_PETCI|nr:hypothetical protein Pcinc_026923 [Petrolisthes cinctipes]